MAVFSDSTVLSKADVKFLLELLPIQKSPLPDIYIFDHWKTISQYTNTKKNLYSQYSLLKSIIQNRVFSTYNFKYNMIFIYLFNLPYSDPYLTKLHGAYCLYHEIRHQQQFFENNTQFDVFPPESSFYSHIWVEKDANQYAVKWMRKNRPLINQQFKLQHLAWDIGVNEHNRLRIIAK
ncbi:hypothetical protein HPT25_01410 [Bacillus sp. BRMEA1]|uniref:hypothetical protein n=1 Tax=Neobacillus endophyticus TaxID=2738405 RepID=UPI001564FAC7|nr:hypothetical protein [Neobacillus endophyticus]NRD76166.1 hypothetical protein [Neobacillus endophyticus]